MKTSRYTEAQIIAILRQAEGGVPVAELCREHGMSNASFYKWRAKYGGMDTSMMARLKCSLPRQVDSEDVEFSACCLNNLGGNFPSAPWGRSSL